MNSDFAVYEAEHVLFSRDEAHRLATVAQAQDFVDQVLADRYFIDRWPTKARLPIQVRGSKRYEWAGAAIESNKIFCPFWALNDITLLHEISHFLTPKREKEDHGPIFCGTNLALIRRHKGVRLARQLKYAYKAYEVEVASL